MTRKDFELIAGVLKDAQSTIAGGRAVVRVDDMAATFADRLASTNPQFDRSRFLRAAGVGG